MPHVYHNNSWPIITDPSSDLFSVNIASKNDLALPGNVVLVNIASRKDLALSLCQSLSSSNVDYVHFTAYNGAPNRRTGSHI